MNKKRTGTILTILIIGLLILACGTSSGEPTEAPAATNAPPATAQPVPTDTRPPRPPRAGDSSEPILTLADLPSGFEENTPDDLSSDYLSYVEFVKLENYEKIVAYNWLLETNAERDEFRSLIEHPEDFVASYAQGSALPEWGPFPTPGIGDSACGVWIITSLEGLENVPYRLEHIFFLRGDTGNVLSMLFQAGQAPSITALDLARLWDQRLTQAGH